MPLTLTADSDPTCRQIAEFLATNLIRLDPEELEVSTVLDYDGMVGGGGLAFPLLQVYRLSSKGSYLDESTLNIDYYLFDMNAYAARPGILRLVEVAIAHLIEDSLPVALNILARASVTGSQRGFLKLQTGEIFPYTRLTVDVQEVNVTSPVVL